MAGRQIWTTFIFIFCYYKISYSVILETVSDEWKVQPNENPDSTSEASHNSKVETVTSSTHKKHELSTRFSRRFNLDDLPLPPHLRPENIHMNTHQPFIPQITERSSHDHNEHVHSHLDHNHDSNDRVKNSDVLIEDFLDEDDAMSLNKHNVFHQTEASVSTFTYTDDDDDYYNWDDYGVKVTTRSIVFTPRTYIKDIHVKTEGPSREELANGQSRLNLDRLLLVSGLIFVFLSLFF